MGLHPGSPRLHPGPKAATFLFSTFVEPVNVTALKVENLVPNLHIFFFKKYLMYLFMRDRERERDRQREKQVPFREPDVGLDPGSPGSGPGPRAALNR